jgi:hypothetical protein
VRSIAGDRGKKEASKEVGEEKGKRKRLYVLRERKKLKRNATRRRSSETAARSCKSESCYSWTCSSR